MIIFPTIYLINFAWQTPTRQKKKKARWSL